MLAFVGVVAFFSLKRKRRHRVVTEERVLLPGEVLDVNSYPLLQPQQAPKKSEPYYLCFDTETASVSPPNADVAFGRAYGACVQLSFALLDDEFRIIEKSIYNIAVAEPLASSATQIHHISNTLKEEGVTPKEAYTHFAKSFAKAKVVAAHNMQFHQQVVLNDMQQCGLPSLPWNNKQLFCTMVQGARFCETRGEVSNGRFVSLENLYATCYFGRRITLRHSNKGEADLLLLIACLRYLQFENECWREKRTIIL